MELNKIYLDSDFSNTVIPSGQRFLFLGYSNGEDGDIVIRYKDSDGNFGNIASGSGDIFEQDQCIEVDYTQNNKMIIPAGSVPVFIKTSAGNFYPIEKDTLSQNGDYFYIDVEPYLAYDNVDLFSGVWTVYLSGGAKGENGKDGQSFQYDEVGVLSDLQEYDDKPYKFAFLATDTKEIYVKLSDNSGDWSEPIPLFKETSSSNESLTAFEVYANDTELTEIDGIQLAYPVAPCMTHKQVIRTTGKVEEQDISIDWGDGTVDVLSDGAYELYVAPADDDLYADSQFTVSHTYAASGKYTVTISGTTYWGLRTPKTASSDGYDIGHEYNLICNAFSKELPIASCVYNLSDFLRGAKRLLNIKTEPYMIHQLSNAWSMFRDCSNLISATGFPSSHIVPCGSIFQDCTALTTTDFVLPYYVRTKGEVGAGKAFYNCNNLVADVSSLLPAVGFSSRITNLAYAFYNCSKLTGEAPSRVLWRNSATRFVSAAGEDNGHTIFEGCSSDLLSAVPTVWGGTLVWDTADTDDGYSFDVAAWTVTTTDANVEYGFGASNTSPMIISWGDGTIEKITTIGAGKKYTHTYASAKTYKISVSGELTRVMYANASATYGAMVDSIEKFPAKTVTSLKNTFAYCSKIQTIPNNVSAEGVSDVYGLFRACSSLRRLPEGFYLPNSITDARFAFSTCTNLRLDISNFLHWWSGTKTVTSMFVNSSSIYGLPDSSTLWGCADITFSDTANAFTGTPASIRALVPQTWGGSSTNESPTTPDTSEIYAQIQELREALASVKEELDTI